MTGLICHSFSIDVSLQVTSHSNFSTIRANTCVCQGKWIYEVMLGSKGVMQLGWSTLDCKFSQEVRIVDIVNLLVLSLSMLSIEPMIRLVWCMFCLFTNLRRLCPEFISLMLLSFTVTGGRW